MPLAVVKAAMESGVATRPIEDLDAYRVKLQSYVNQAGLFMQPMIEKANQAINDVAKENGFTYVFDTASGSLLVFPDGDDILPLVKTKLGL